MNKQKRKPIVRTLLLVFVAMYVGVTFYLYNAQSVVGNALPTPFGYGASVVLSGSMEPMIKQNDVIVVENTDAIKLGDVIVYQEQQTLIVHRVVAKSGNEIYTKGDANPNVDQPIQLSQVKGKVIAVIPFVGVMVHLFKHPLGVLAILALAFLLLEMSYHNQKVQDQEMLKDLRLEIENMKKESEGQNEDEETTRC